MKYIKFIILVVLSSCNQMEKIESEPYILVLGVAQDAGFPQANCSKSCCKEAWEDEKKRTYVSCIALVDPQSNEQWIFDATPDIKFQLNLLTEKSKLNEIDGVFLTHAHMGHYTGLMYFGREVIGTKKLPVYSMKRMRNFLKDNAPWNQLVELNNINLIPIKEDSSIKLNPRITVTPFLVPHRAEYTETVGYKIETKNKSLIFIPDIDKWNIWEKNITDIIKNNDFAFLDGTFYKNGELNRDMSEIPHPFIDESMALFSSLDNVNKNKIYFIHLNHTNPVLQKNSLETKTVEKKGFNIARQGEIIVL